MPQTSRTPAVETDVKRIRFRRAIETICIPIENKLEKWVGLSDSSPAPAVFIIGPPRSGSTLLYQILTQNFKTTFFSNLTLYFFLMPTLAGLVHRWLRPLMRQCHYASRYGRTKGWLGPNEAGAFWYRWFPRGQKMFVSGDAFPEKSKDELTRAVKALIQAGRAPAIFKNTYNSMRIGPLAKALPNAAFLVCKRNLTDMAQSILLARLALHSNKQRWLGVAPPEIDRIRDKPYCEQIALQILYTYRQIDNDRQTYGENRFMEVEYQNLCQQPKEATGRIVTFLSTHGIQLEKTKEIPDSFPYSTGKNAGISRDDYLCLRRALSKYNGNL